MFFSIDNPSGVRLLSQFRLNFSHLNKHKFKYNFKECVSPMCGCRLEIESTQHFFLCCHFYYVERSEFLNSLYNIDLSINKLNEDSIIQIILFCRDKYQKETNKKILNCITYLKACKRFDEPIL